MQDIHSANTLNEAKSSALTAKWLLKHPIIQITATGKLSEREQKINYGANALFAINEVERKLGIDILQKDVKDILYHFTYRFFCERHFYIIFDLLYKLYHK